MHDQASELRQLVRREARHDLGESGTQPGLVVVAGGKGGVGTTTVAVNLAVCLAGQGHRTVLVDADLPGGDASLLCRLEQRDGLADVLSARRTVREVLQPGPGGIRVLPGVWGRVAATDESSVARQRLVDGLLGLGNLADVVVADAGNSGSRLSRDLWKTAETVLAVTTPELPAVMDTYAIIKSFTTENLLVPIHLVVNQAVDEQAAREVHDRLARTCLRFLAVPITPAGHVPSDPTVAEAAGQGRAFATASPDCPAAGRIRHLASYVASTLPTLRTVAPRIVARRVPARSVPLEL